MTSGYPETRQVKPFKQAAQLAQLKRIVEYQPLVQVMKVLINVMQLIPVVHDVRKSFLFVRLVHVINFSEITFAFDEGERLLFVYRTRSSNLSLCHAISRFGGHLGPACHTLPRSQVFSFSRPGDGIYFVTLVHRGSFTDETLAIFCLPQVCL